MHKQLPNTIDTSRLILRPAQLADAGAIFEAYTQDPAVSRFMVWTPHVELQETETFVADCVAAADDPARTPYVVTLRDQPDTPIGMVEARRREYLVDLGYVLARKHWGQGLMPEAIMAVSAAALEIPSVYRIQASCDVENLGSQRALEKAGFVREARHERHTVHPNISPEPRPCFMYAYCK